MKQDRMGLRTASLRAMITLAASVVILFVLPLDVASGQEDPETPTPAAETSEAETSAEEEPAIDPAVLEQLREGSQVYSQICSSCHQPGGTGISGQFPPLINNPNVDDAAYLESVIDDGLQGEITVAGETYNGVMPSFGTLNDEETDAVIAYIQNDFQVPPGGEEAETSSGPVAGTELPALTNMTAILAYLLAASVAGLVLAPRLLSKHDRLNVPWLDAWLKTAVIVIAVALFTVYIPDWILKTTAVAKLDRIAQDFIGVAVWGAGLGAILWGLWYAHRDSRI